MKIAIFTDTFLPKIDGIVTATLSLAMGLANNGHKVCIIAPEYNNFKEFKYKNIKVTRMNSIPALFYPEFKITNPFSIRVYMQLKKEKIDLVHFQTPLTIGMQGIIIAKLLKVPLIGTFHTLIADPKYLKHVKINGAIAQGISWAYARAYYNQCDLITCPSESVKNELLEHTFIKPIKVISNGIDFSLFDNSNWKKVKEKYNPNGKTLLFIGRIAHEKSIPYLLDCFKLVLKKLPKTKLILVGDGPQFKEIKNYIRFLKIENSAILTGKIEHENLIKSGIFKAADLFVTASTTETQGITMLEAQVNGLVSIGMDAGGTKELIKNNYNGYLVKKGKKEFADKIVKLLKDSSLIQKMQRNTLKEIKKHNMKKVIEIWEKEYQSLIK